MKEVILEGREFNRLIAATKGFISKTDRRPIYRYIKIDVEKSINSRRHCDSGRM